MPGCLLEGEVDVLSRHLGRPRIMSFSGMWDPMDGRTCCNSSSIDFAACGIVVVICCPCTI
jgi:hypothetical protein